MKSTFLLLTFLFWATGCQTYSYDNNSLRATLIESLPKYLGSTFSVYLRDFELSPNASLELKKPFNIKAFISNNQNHIHTERSSWKHELKINPNLFPAETTTYFFHHNSGRDISNNSDMYFLIYVSNNEIIGYQSLYLYPNELSHHIKLGYYLPVTDNLHSN